MVTRNMPNFPVKCVIRQLALSSFAEAELVETCSSKIQAHQQTHRTQDDLHRLTLTSGIMQKGLETHSQYLRQYGCLY